MEWQRLSLAALVAASLMVPGLAAAAPQRPSDATLRTRVEDRLLRDGDVSADWITVRVKNGVAVLSGTVATALARRWSAALAGSVRGIRGVVNLVTVAPAHRRDRNIVNDVEASLVVDPAIAAQPITVTSIDGTVTLGGTVASNAEKRLAALSAPGVVGVRSINNDITVAKRGTRSDEGIAADVREIMRWDPWLCDAPPQVRVGNGTVTLDGTVASRFERRRAARLARVDGVVAVVDRLRIDTSAPGAAMVSAPSRYAPAARVMGAIRATFAADSRLRHFAPQVAVVNYTVTLSGSAPSFDTASAAREDARSVPGAGEILDRIEVMSAARPGDRKLEREIHDALARDPLVPIDDIMLTVKHGHVLLRGVVGYAAQRGYAADIAARILGVRGITDELTVLRSTPGQASTPLAAMDSGQPGT